MNNRLRGEPWLRYRDTGLYAVPSVHYRQVFGQLVYEACLRKRFDVIAVELPPSYKDLGIVDAFLSMAPAPGLVIDPGGAGEWIEVPVNDHPDCVDTELRYVTRARCYAMTCCDSIVMALRCPGLLADRWPGWRPEIALVDAENPWCERPVAEPHLRDDYDVITDGLAAVYGRVEDGLQACRVVEVDARRELIMADRLRAFLAAGKEVLFVCGAAHWRGVCECLDRGAGMQPAPRSQPPARLVLAPVDPALVWLWGWLDDIPRVVWEFEQACHHGQAAGFDKLAAIDVVIRESIGEGLAAHLPVSARRLLKMCRYWRNLAAGAARQTPELDPHLVHAAEACVERRFAEVLKEVALRFPAPLPPGVERARFVSIGEGRFAVLVGEEAFVVEPVHDGAPGQRLPIPVPRQLSREERDQVERDKQEHGGSLLLCTAVGENDLHNRLMKRARHLAHCLTRETTARRFSGDLGQGPAWRQTIRSRATGEKALYVRQMKRRPRLQVQGECDDRCPVVWIFDVSSPIRSKSTGFIAAEAHSRKPAVHSALYWVSKKETLADGLIFRSHNAYFVSLMRGLVPVRDPGLELARAVVASFPEKRRCRVRPWEDPELQHLNGHELAVGCGIKYAADHVIVVALPSVPLGPAVHAYAARKGVRIIRVSRDDFEPAALERLAWDHSVPAPDNESPPYPWCDEFVPPVW